MRSPLHLLLPRCVRVLSLPVAAAALSLGALSLGAPRASAQTALIAERFEWLDPQPCVTPLDAHVNRHGDVLVTCRNGIFPDRYTNVYLLRASTRTSFSPGWEPATGAALNDEGRMAGEALSFNQTGQSRALVHGIQVNVLAGDHVARATVIDARGVSWGQAQTVANATTSQRSTGPRQVFRMAHPAATPEFVSGLPGDTRAGPVSTGGTAVAWFFDCTTVDCAGQDWRLFVLRPQPDGTLQRTQLPGRTSGNPTTVPFAVNDLGQVAGETSTSFGGFDGVSPGFFWDGTRYVSLPLLPGDAGYSTANGLTNDGFIVGFSRDCSNGPCDRAVAWTDGGTTVHNLNSVVPGFVASGSLLSEATDVSENRWVAGFGFDAATNRMRPFRLKLADPSTVVVNDTRDFPDANLSDGVCDVALDTPGLQCTLRAGIQESNARPRRQTMLFAIVGDGGVAPSETPRIRPTSPLPPVTDSLRLVASSQPGTGTVQVDGADLGGVADGLVLNADSVEVEGLTVTGFGGYGLAIVGGRGVYVRGTRVGALAEGDTTNANGLGALRLDGTPERVVLGSPRDSDPANVFVGTVSVAPTARAALTLRRGNAFALPRAEANDATRALVDLGGDGPTCSPWTPPSAASATPPPRLLHQPFDGSGATAWEGMTLPRARVVLWRADETGAGEGRYWARRATAVADTVADANGRFALDAFIGSGTRFAVSASAPGRGSSELSQVLRPVIAIPGIGGTHLEVASNGDNVWLPLGDRPNDRLANLALPPDGRPDGRLRTDGVVELLGLVYGPMMQALQDGGYAGNPANAGPETLDLWRFANDWRLSPGLLADSLRTLVTRLTDGSAAAGGVARACEVDLVGHSNGGVIAGVYVRRDGAHAADRVHRLVTSGTPYLGAAQAIGGHTAGYIFGVEKELGLLFAFGVEWGRMLTMTRNVPGAYMLMPSPGYFAAADASKPSNAGNAVAIDLYGGPLTTHTALRTFLTDPQTDAGVPLGMGRNAPLWDEQIALQTLLGDWRSHSGPPQVYRHVGHLDAQTTVGWTMGPGPERLAPGATPRDSPGDTDRHRAYRERLRPIPGPGDTTVPLVSGSLGRHPLVGGTDFSGVGVSPWIEEFEYFACGHIPLVDVDCRSLEGGIDALPRLVQTLQSGHVAVNFGGGGGGAAAHRGDGAVSGGASRTAQALGVAREVVYVSGTAALRVSVLDDAGRLTGRADTSTFVSYQIPGVTFTETTLGATVGLDPAAAYTVEATAPDGATVYATRVAVSGADGSGSQALFAPVTVGAGGRVRIVFGAGGTPLATPLSVDATGDGAFEANALPAATLSGGAAPLLPLPTPADAVVAGAAGDTTRHVATVALPAAGAGWTWSLTGAAAWNTPEATSGTVPATLRFGLRATALPQGVARDTLTLRLENGAFAYETPVFLAFDVGNPLPVELVAFTAARDGDAVRLAWETAAETNNAGFAVEVRPARAANADARSVDARRDGGDWRAVAFVPGHGTTSERHRYTYVVTGLAPGRHAFRLRQTDLDGATELSPEVEAAVGFDGPLFASPLRPDPVRGDASMRVLVASPARVRADVYDVLGRHVARVYDYEVETEALVRVSTRGWAAGLYIVRVETGAGASTRAFTVVR